MHHQILLTTYMTSVSDRLIYTVRDIPIPEAHWSLASLCTNAPPSCTCVYMCVCMYVCLCVCVCSLTWHRRWKWTRGCPASRICSKSWRCFVVEVPWNEFPCPKSADATTRRGNPKPSRFSPTVEWRANCLANTAFLSYTQIGFYHNWINLSHEENSISLTQGLGSPTGFCMTREHSVRMSWISLFFSLRRIYKRRSRNGSSFSSSQLQGLGQISHLL